MAPRRFGEEGLHAPTSGGLLALLEFKGEGCYLSSRGLHALYQLLAVVALATRGSNPRRTTGVVSEGDPAMDASIHGRGHPRGA